MVPIIHLPTGVGLSIPSHGLAALKTLRHGLLEMLFFMFAPRPTPAQHPSEATPPSSRSQTQS